MEFENAQHKQLHELLIQLGYSMQYNPAWKYHYQSPNSGFGNVYFDDVRDGMINSNYLCDSSSPYYLDNKPVVEVLSKLRSLLPSDATPTEQADTEEVKQLHELLIEVGYTDVGAPNWKHYYQDATGNKLYFNDAADYQICGSIIHPLRGVKMYLKKLSLTQVLDILKTHLYSEDCEVDDTEQVDTEDVMQQPNDLSSTKPLNITSGNANVASPETPVDALEIYKNSGLAQLVEVDNQNCFTLDILKFNVLNMNKRIYTKQSFADINLPYVPCDDELAQAALKFKGPDVYLESIEILEDKVIGKFKLLSDELFKFSKCLVYPSAYGRARLKCSYDNNWDEVVDYTLNGCNLELLSIDGIESLKSPSYAELAANYKQVEDTEQVNTVDTKQLAHTGLITVGTIAEALRNHPNATYNASNTIFSFHSGVTVMINGASMKHKYGVADDNTGMATNDFAQFLGWLLYYGICLVEPIDFNAELAKLGFNSDGYHPWGIKHDDRYMELEWMHNTYEVPRTQACIDAIKLAIEAMDATEIAEAALNKLAG